MRELAGNESFSLDGPDLRLSFVSAESFVTGELIEPGGEAALRVPVVAVAGGQSCAFNLARLPGYGEFELVLHAVGGDTVRLGGQTLRNFRLLNQDKRPRRKVAASDFPRGSATGHALLYADFAGQTLRLRVSEVDDAASFLAEAAAPERHERGSRSRSSRRFSVISAVYNAAPYLDEFFASITSQTLDFRSHIELIMVDDGSTDRSVKIIRKWQQKYPRNIICLRMEHQGPGPARNLGLERASHDWITFIDSDDFVARDYFERVGETIEGHGEESVAVVSCSVVPYYEATGTEADIHPLRFRFASGERAVSIDELGMDIQVTVCGGFWRRDLISAHRLGFDARVRPGSEDASFAGRYLLRATGRSLVFQPASRYFHRRRQDQSSLTQTGWKWTESYDDELRYGHLSLLGEARTQHGRVPIHIQNIVLYCLSFVFRRAVDNPEAIAFLSEDQRSRYVDLLRETFSFIDIDTIAAYEISLLLPHRIGILNVFKDADPPTQTVEITDLDQERGLLRLVYWSRRETPEDVATLDRVPVDPAFRKLRRIDFMGAPFVYEHIRWLPVIPGQTLRATVDGTNARIRIGGRLYDDGLPVADIRPALTPSVPSEFLLPPHVQEVRRAALGQAAAEAFRNAWLFMDRDNEADDSAEFLYRYFRRRAPEINAFFILQRSSAHWDRLAAQGFRLIGFNEPEHAIALLNATHLISSQADHYVGDYLGRREFGDRLRYKFVFLQHGVTQGDYSDWFNQRQIDCLTTSSVAEFQSIVGDGSPYRLTEKEVVLTGLARHDALLGASREDQRTIVIMPTWRAWLTGIALGPGNVRSRHPDFAGSDFARRWKGLLHAPRLAALAAECAYRFVFVPHPNLVQHLDFFDLPDFVECRSFGDPGSVQDLFGGMSLFVTDFSSKAFDAAYLEKPVLYYQFDAGEFFGGGHSGRPGYFDYERDGFGPVLHAEEDVLTAMERIAAGTPPDPVYRERARAIFPFRDGRCCERIYQAILNLSMPYRSQEPATAFAAPGGR